MDGKVFCFCTCAEKNQDVYLKRVEHWFHMLQPIQEYTDFYCAIDGKINVEKLQQLKNINITFFNLTPALGRPTCGCFPGFRRSFGQMIGEAFKRGYDYAVHIENDVQVINFDKVKEYIRKEGLYASFNTRYRFLESAFLMINDRPSMELLYNMMQEEGNLYSNLYFEYQVGNNFKFEFPFISYRKDEQKDIENADFICQAIK